MAAALTVARPQGTPGPLMRDFESYYAAGQAFAARHDPYGAGIWDYERAIPGVDASRNELLPFVGPPAFLPLWALLALLPFTAAAVVWACILLAVTGTFLILILSRARAVSLGTLAAAVCMLAAFGPFTSGMALGQAALLSFAAVCAAALMLGRSARLAAVWVFFAAVQPNVALLLCSQLGRRRALAAFGAAFGAFAVLCVAFAGPAGALHYVQGLRAHAAAERFVLIQITPGAIAYGFGLSTAVASVTGIACAVGAFFISLRVWQTQTFRPLWKLAITCALLPFAVPFFHEHDFVVLLLPALLCLSLEDRGTWSIAAAGAMFVGSDWLGMAQRPDAFAQVVLLAIAQLCAMFALGDVPLRRILLPACVLPAVVAAHFIALRFPAPVWPDAMRGAASLAAPVASVWHDELVSTGQFAQQPAWAALRLLTLTGCALLAWAAYGAAAARDQMERL